MAQPGETAVSARLRTCRVLHAAMVGSLLLYAAVVHLLRSSGWRGTAESDVLPMVRWVFYGLGTAELIAVLALRPRFLSPAALREVRRGSGAETALRELQTRLVVFMALSEGIAIYGLVLFLLGGMLGDFYLLWGAGFLGQLVLTPRRELWEEVARTGARQEI